MKKKILLGLMALVMVLALGVTACGSKKETLVMATNPSFPPYEYYDGSEIIGIDAEIAQCIADKLGMELEIVSTEFGSIVAGVQTHKFDMGMAGMTVTEERLKSIDFSTSYAQGVQVVIVKEGSAIKSVDDLTGTDYKIGVQQDTTGHIYAASDYGDDRVLAYKTGNDAVQALITGKVDCVITDNEPAKNYVAANSSENLVILDTEYIVEDYAICVAKDNTDLLNKINDAIAELQADGTIDAILKKYIG